MCKIKVHITNKADIDLDANRDIILNGNRLHVFGSDNVSRSLWSALHMLKDHCENGKVLELAEQTSLLVIRYGKGFKMILGDNLYILPDEEFLGLVVGVKLLLDYLKKATSSLFGDEFEELLVH